MNKPPIHPTTEKLLTSIQYLIIGLIILIGACLIYAIHGSYSAPYIDPHNPSIIVTDEQAAYPYPIHADEWSHLTIANSINNNGEIPSKNPAVPTYNYDAKESGFQIAIAQMIGLSGLEGVNIYQYFPIIGIILTLISIYLLVYTITRNFFIATITMIFVLYIRSNINIMGTWFAVPLTFSLFLLCMNLTIYLQGKRIIDIKEKISNQNKKHVQYVWTYLALFLLFFITAFITYPLVAILVALAIISNETVTYMFNNKESIKKLFKNATDFSIS